MRRRFKLYRAKRSYPWPDDAINLAPAKMRQLYRNGFAGVEYSEEERDSFLDSLTWPDGEAAASQFGLMESGAGKLSLPYLAAWNHYQFTEPFPGQETGSCVGHAGKNCVLILSSVEALLGKPDEVTGVVEGFPVVSDEARRNGVFCFENIYGDRGHSGQGANCSTLQRHVTQTGGTMLRQNYPDLGIDFTHYQTRLSINWGRSKTPDNVRAVAKKNQIRAATDCPTEEVARDFVANGYVLWVCSGYGWSSTRDENGYSKRSGSWAHSWDIIGYDDREETKQRYGFPLALYLHDWAKWNRGGRRILGTQIDIPEGCMWIDARLLRNCDCTAMSGYNGFPAQKLPDWGTGSFL